MRPTTRSAIIIIPNHILFHLPFPKGRVILKWTLPVVPFRHRLSIPYTGTRPLGTVWIPLQLNPGHSQSTHHHGPVLRILDPFHGLRPESYDLSLLGGALRSRGGRTIFGMQRPASRILAPRLPVRRTVTASWPWHPYRRRTWQYHRLR